MIHLSFFTGIGTASLALQRLNTHTLHTFWWETDPGCIHHFKQTFDINHTFMGDVWEIDIPHLVETLRGHLMPGTKILITTAPPCKDHSKIRDSPPGLTGQDGSLLQHMVDIEWAIRLLIPTSNRDPHGKRTTTRINTRTLRRHHRPMGSTPHCI